MSDYRNYKQEWEDSTINDYIGNKNYAKDLYSELSDKREKEKPTKITDDEDSNIREFGKQFDEIQKEIREIEKTKPRYSSKEDISTLEFKEYPSRDGEDPKEHQFLSVGRNFISEVEREDLTELMCRIDENIIELEGYTDVESLQKCMKSLVRVVHRFKNTREHFLPITETHQSRDANTLWD